MTKRTLTPRGEMVFACAFLASIFLYIWLGTIILSWILQLPPEGSTP